MDHGNGDTGCSGSGSHGLRGNKDPSLPPQPDAHGRGDSDTHQPTRLAGNPSGWGLRPGSLSMEGGVAGGVSDSLPPPTPSPHPSSTYGTRPRPGASSAASKPVHLCTLIATSLWMAIAHPRGESLLWHNSPASWQEPILKTRKRRSREG